MDQESTSQRRLNFASLRLFVIKAVALDITSMRLLLPVGDCHHKVFAYSHAVLSLYVHIPLSARSSMCESNATFPTLGEKSQQQIFYRIPLQVGMDL